jgi:hypothetical protein
MTWDWIADTLAMIETDLRERVKMCDRVAKANTERALRDVASAKSNIVDAVVSMERARERAAKKAAENPLKDPSDEMFF